MDNGKQSIKFACSMAWSRDHGEIIRHWQHNIACRRWDQEPYRRWPVEDGSVCSQLLTAQLLKLIHKQLGCCGAYYRCIQQHRHLTAIKRITSRSTICVFFSSCPSRCVCVCMYVYACQWWSQGQSPQGQGQGYKSRSRPSSRPWRTNTISFSMT